MPWKKDELSASVPYRAGSPWPCMRGNARNTGKSPLVSGDAGFERAGAMVLRRWRTGNGIFSTPVVGEDETIYVGSADKLFYALDPVSGDQRWTRETGECIDCAGCIDADGTIWFVSCDAGLYGVSPEGEDRWALNLFEDRRHFTPSTIFWWEANVALGPNGWLFAGNDDFSFYAIEPGVGVRWAHLTGLHIWTAPAFGDDGSVYFVSFDLNLYAVDAETGAERWRRNVGNFVASSPAVAPDGTILFGGFDGVLQALDPEDGRQRWALATGGPIYATPAIADDGTVYIGSSDGNLYAVRPDGPEVLWTFYTGDAIRCSAVLGPDPEGEADYLVYVGGGGGLIYAIDPQGRRRWSLDTRVGAGEVDAPNINASMALGRTGLCTANAAGEVFFVPYHLYLDAPETPGLELEPSDGYPDDGSHLFYVSPGGTIDVRPLPDTAPDAPWTDVEPGQVISLRLLSRRGGRTLRARLDPGRVAVQIEPPLPHRVTVHPDGGQLDVVPVRPGRAGESFTVTVAAGFEGEGEPGTVRAALRVARAGAVDAPAIDGLPELPFRVTHMAVFDPTIVPSFDQIGIASLTVRVRVVHVDEERGKVVAWGLQKFGMEDDGESVQIAVPRALYWALDGIWDDGRVVFTARGCHFELTSFPVPLDTLRLSGTWAGDAGPGVGASLAAELDVVSRFQLLRRLLGRRQGDPKVERAPARVPWSRMASFARTWVPDLKSLRSSLPLVLRSVTRTLPLAWRVPRRSLYGPWGLIGEDGWFRGSGNFRTSVDHEATGHEVEVRRFRYEPRRGRIVATITAKGATAQAFGGLVPGLLLVDTDVAEPLFLDYDAATTIERDHERATWKIELRLPRSFDPAARRWRAWLLVDTTPVDELDIGR